MGIKFRCPNGHKLNVKAFLAGKRGICPKCGERFEIPMHSGGQVVSRGRKRPQAEERQPGGRSQGPGTRDPAAGSLGTNGGNAPTVLDEPEVTSGAAPESPASPDLLSGDPNSVWYVRPASGGQFGPAADRIMRQWIDEGRIAADSMVWQSGWETWQKADEVFPEARTDTAPTDPQHDLPDAELPVVNASERPLARHKSQPMMTLTLYLIGVVIVLAVVLVAVVVSMR